MTAVLWNDSATVKLWLAGTQDDTVHRFARPVHWFFRPAHRSCGSRSMKLWFRRVTTAIDDLDMRAVPHGATNRGSDARSRAHAERNVTLHDLTAVLKPRSTTFEKWNAGLAMRNAGLETPIGALEATNFGLEIANDRSEHTNDSNKDFWCSASARPDDARTERTRNRTRPRADVPASAQFTSTGGSMKARQRQVLRSFRRVREFIAANVPAESQAGLGVQLAELDDVLSSITEMATEQEAGSRLTSAETRRQATLRMALWDRHMLPVSRVAREVFGSSPGVDAALRMPSKRTADSQLLLAAAAAMAEAAQPHAALFVSHGLSQNFVTELREAATRLETALTARETTQRRTITATAGVSLQITRGRRAVRLLNAILAPRLAGNGDLLATWNSVRRVRAVSGGGVSVAVTPEIVQTPAEKVA